MSEREEEAFRNALRGLASDEEVSPHVARRTVWVTQAALVLVLLLGVSAVVLLPRVLGGAPAGGTAAGPVSDARAESAPVPPGVAQRSPAAEDDAPAEWRTEYFRDISFSVPAGWGYAVPPQSDWCADEPQGEPRPDQRTPYVWLGMDIPVRAIGCPDPRPDSLLTEHVEAVAPGPATDYVEGEFTQAGWLIVTRFVGSAVLVVTTRDRELAEQILDSAHVADDSAPCPAVSPVAGALGTRPATSSSLAEMSSSDWVAVCQYEPVADQADASLPRLRVASVREGSAAQDLLDELRGAPENTTSCDPAPVDNPPDLAIVIRVASSDGVREVYAAASGCPDGDPGMAGGIDDGTTVRLLTRSACQALLIPPLALFAGTGDVGTNCLG